MYLFMYYTPSHIYTLEDLHLLSFRTPIISLDYNNKFTMYYYKMGIYDNGNIFGIKMYNFNHDDFANILF